MSSWVGGRSSIYIYIYIYSIIFIWNFMWYSISCDISILQPNTTNPPNIIQPNQRPPGFAHLKFILWGSDQQVFLVDFNLYLGAKQRGTKRKKTQKVLRMYGTWKEKCIFISSIFFFEVRFCVIFLLVFFFRVRLLLFAFMFGVIFGADPETIATKGSRKIKVKHWQFTNRINGSFHTFSFANGSRRPFKPLIV